MKKLGDVGELSEFLDGACKRLTGRDLSEWEVEFSNRRGRGLASGDLKVSKVYSLEESNRVSRIYGLDNDDWEAVWVDTGRIERENPKYTAPAQRGDFAGEAIAFRLNPENFPDVL